MAKQTHYVLYYCERLRDGIEEGAKVYSDLGEAVARAEKIRNGFAGDNKEVRLFKLGEEIPLTETTVEQPQPSKKTVRVSVGVIKSRRKS